VGDVPEAYIFAGESLFLHVLANVLRNAANASPAGGLIDLDVRVVEDHLEFVVTDDGPGVASEIADTMFEPFASTTANGTGLGLAMAAYVMENLGGRIRYRKVPNRGACFTVSLPVVTR
jgi:signal transduction histidine kinase